MILLPWEKSPNLYFRRQYKVPLTDGSLYGWIIFHDKKFFYHAIRPDASNIFKAVGSGDSDFVNSLEEAKKIVDEALINSGWRLLEQDDNLMVLA